MDVVELRALADRCEKATGPDLGLMREAYDACLPRQLPSSAGTIRWSRHYLRFSRLIEAEAWLDAAMTLVPEGFMWRVQSWPDGVNEAILEKGAGDFGAIDARHTETFAATPALALCAAALRARAAQKDTPDGRG